jgi:hypothetical protein
MDTRKVTFIATIAAIILVAVGIGYAYTAATQNSNNSASPEFITLVQGGSGGYTFADEASIYWDTTDIKNGSGGATTFTLESVVADTPVTGYKAVVVGNSFVVKTAIETPKGAGDLTNLTCSLSSSGFAAPYVGDTGTSSLFVSVKSGAHDPETFQISAADTFSKWDGDSFEPGSTFTIYKNTGLKTYEDVAVTVYYGYTGTGVTKNHDSGVQPEGPTQKPIAAGSSLTFTVNQTGSNMSFSLSKTAMTLAASASDTTTITFNPSSFANKDVTFEYSVVGVVTAAISESTITVTAAGTPAGDSVVVTVKSVADPSKTATINVTISS